MKKSLVRSAKGNLFWRTSKNKILLGGAILVGGSAIAGRIAVDRAIKRGDLPKKRTIEVTTTPGLINRGRGTSQQKRLSVTVATTPGLIDLFRR